MNIEKTESRIKPKDHMSDVENEKKVNNPVKQSNSAIEGARSKKKVSSGNSEAIRTFCRIRPIDKENEIFKVKEDSEGRTLLVNCDPALLKKLNAVPTFTFTKTFDESSKQIEVFEFTCKGLVEDLVKKKKSGLIFTYGMTNAGKTFTVIGSQTEPGILPMSLKYLYQQLEASGNEASVFCNFVEIYNEEVFDLLSTDPKNKFFKKKIPIKENSRKIFFLPDVTYTKISTLEDFKISLNTGIMKKVHASTNLNQNSSRSHTIFKIIMKFPDEEEVSLSIVDLAGSERANRTEALGKELQEACKINQSLSVLGKCMEALRFNSIYTQKKIVPFRESKLTMLFQEYFQGDQNIIMVTNINPRREDFEETIRALNYSCVAREIKPIKSKIIVNPLKKQVKLTSTSNNIENNSKSDKNIPGENMIDINDITGGGTELNLLKLEIEKLKEEFLNLKNKVKTDDGVSPEEVNNISTEGDINNSNSNVEPTQDLMQFQSHINQMSHKIQTMQTMNMMKSYSYCEGNPMPMMFPSYPMNYPMNMSNQLFNPYMPSEYNPGNLQQGIDFEFLPPSSSAFNLVFINSKFNDFCMGAKKKRTNQKNKKKKDEELSVSSESHPVIDLKDIFDDPKEVVIREIVKEDVNEEKKEPEPEPEPEPEIEIEEKKPKKKRSEPKKGEAPEKKKKKKNKKKKAYSALILDIPLEKENELQDFNQEMIINQSNIDNKTEESTVDMEIQQPSPKKEIMVAEVVS